MRPSIAKIVVDVSLDRMFDYQIPPALMDQVAVGSHVNVPFGRRHAQGFVVSLETKSAFKELKNIHSVIGTHPLIGKQMMELACWMAEYYAAPIEPSIRTVLPSAVRKKNAQFSKRLFVYPLDKALDDVALEKLRKRAPKQARVIELLRSDELMQMSELARAAETTSTTIRTLEKNGFLRIDKQNVERDPFAQQTILPTQPLELMQSQKDAFKIVCRSIDAEKPKVTLLYGVTGSGKTEVYLQALDYALKQGKGGIILVPEIALTPQTVERFRGRFGEGIAVLHSHLSDGERHDEWHRINEGKARIVIGARSALFAPVHQLGLIVVDEEHENTYKQSELPRYNARDVAVMRGHMEGCAVVLGSATPALESYNNALSGKYTLATLPERADNRRMPVVRVIDMRLEAEKKGGGGIFSQDLVEAIRLRLKRGEQIILFLNRRGFSTSLICEKCGYVASCESCSIAMTYHKIEHLLRCHICGAARRVPPVCPAPECGDPNFKYSGTGTQRVEEIVSKLFPRARVQRMDSDTTVRKESYGRYLGDFRSGKIDILIGTQMIAKGLHFPNVTLVGIIFADMSLHLPDFRAGERTFQLLTQVAGRAGRGDVSGEVIVQTYTPFHPAIQAARRIDFEGFIDQELEFRKELLYPPFTHLVCLTLRGKDEAKLKETGERFAKQLRALLHPDVRMAGPAPAPLARAKNYYRYQIMMRAKTSKSMTRPIKQVMQKFKWPRDIHCAVDVDALSLL